RELGIRMVNENLVQGTWGNASLRIDDRYMLATPSGLDYLSLKPEDMVVVDIYTLEYPAGGLKPTSEKGIHAGIYRARPEIKCVLHSHPLNSSVYAAAHAVLPLKTEEHKKLFNNDKIALAEYGLPSTDKLVKNTLAALKEANAVFMKNHGVTCCGPSGEEALNTLRVLEKLAEL
ncbi:MAG TPA: class II aldolase/adducin family protein, partial [Clostridia bacterium]|nr:class II aldolase/adducin family protein [Clostridia bacterium]